MAIIKTCIAPVNIAVIKYWGKRDEELILPLNDSISVTLSTNELRAKTTVFASPDIIKDRIWLNGKEESINNQRLVKCLSEIRRRAKALENSNGCSEDEISNWKVHICSENNFPTAAGLASSAAGYACLVHCLGKVYGVEGDLSTVARLGSGSACRSLFGGFVQWLKGTEKDGSDSFAKQIAPSVHWPDFRILVLVVAEDKKKVSSTSGMQRSVETSKFLKHRVECIVPERVSQITNAIGGKDFKNFAEITMRDSNQFHSVCLDTFPPAVYMNDISHTIVNFVHSYNSKKGETKLAYTFDAGPNACLFLLKENVNEVVALIKHSYPPADNAGSFVRGIDVKDVRINSDMTLPYGPYEKGLLKFIIHTKVGEGPDVLIDENVHLLNNKGFPKNP